MKLFNTPLPHTHQAKENEGMSSALKGHGDSAWRIQPQEMNPPNTHPFALKGHGHVRRPFRARDDEWVAPFPGVETPGSIPPLLRSERA